MTEVVATTTDVPALTPARMLNEFAYCPRLAWLEWVVGDFADSADTVDGRRLHLRVDKEGGALPVPAELTEAERLHARSIYLSAPELGLVARIDLVETTGTIVTPVDYKCEASRPTSRRALGSQSGCNFARRVSSSRGTGTSAAKGCCTSPGRDAG